LSGDIGRCRFHASDGLHLLQDLVVVGEAALFFGDHNVWPNPHDPRFEVGLKSGHDGNDNNQRHHPYGDTGNGQDRDQRDKGPLLTRSEISPGYKCHIRHGINGDDGG